MKGLFYYLYDHYEWEDLICVSNSESKLKDKYNEINNDDDELVLCYERHVELYGR